MSRPSVIWIVFWVVILCLIMVVWQVFQTPDEMRQASPSTGSKDVNAQEADLPAVGDLHQEPMTGLKPNGLLQSLPAPQSPPLKFDAQSKKQWHDELTGLIDDAAYLDDEASLRMLIVEFGNPDAEIAKAAFTSLQARRDENSLPYLEEMSELNLRPEKRRQLDDLIQFLKQKSVFEHMRSKEP